jgi:hypothetical protein
MTWSLAKILTPRKGQWIMPIKENDDIEELKVLLQSAGYQVCEISEPFGELIPIQEAIKDAPMYWP